MTAVELAPMPVARRKLGPAVGQLTAAWVFATWLLPSALARWSPLAPVASIASYSEWRILLLIVISACAAGVLYSYRRMVPSDAKHKIGILFAAISSLFVLLIASTALFGATSDDNCVPALLAIIGGLLAVRLAQNTRSSLVVIAVLGVVQSLYILQQYFMGQNVVTSGWSGELGSALSDSNALRAVTVVAITVAASEILRVNRMRALATWILALGVLLSSLLLTLSFVGIVSACVGIGVMLNYKFRTLRAAVLSVSLGCVLFSSAWYIHERQTTVQDSPPRAARAYVDRLQVGSAVFANNFLLGVGIGRSPLPLDPCSGCASGITFYSTFREPGNLFLYWLGALGLGGAILLSMFCVGVWRILRSSDQSHVLSGIWTSVIIVGMFETLFGPPGSDAANALLGALLGATLLQAAER
jgi:hypothetical protein